MGPENNEILLSVLTKLLEKWDIEVKHWDDMIELGMARGVEGCAADLRKILWGFEGE